MNAAPNDVTGFSILTDRLCRHIPMLGIFDLAAAWLAHFFGYHDSLLIAALAGATILAGIPVLMRVTLGKRGLRSIEQLGFSGVREAVRYDSSFKGYPRSVLCIMLAAFATSAFMLIRDGGKSTDLFLAFSVFWSVGVVGRFTRSWPSDANKVPPSSPRN